MADVLGAHPLASARGAVDPRKVSNTSHSSQPQQQPQSRMPSGPLLTFDTPPGFPDMAASTGPGVGHWAQGGSRVPTGRWGGYANGLSMPEQRMIGPALNTGLVAGARGPEVGTSQGFTGGGMLAGYPGMGVGGNAMVYAQGMGGMGYGQQPGMGGYQQPMMGMQGYSQGMMGVNGVPQQDMVERWRQQVHP